MTIEELRDVAAKRNITIPAKDESDFLTLLRAADLAVKHVDALPPYVDPRLAPDGAPDPEGLAKLRLFTKPAPEDNPLNAWSHKASLALALRAITLELTVSSATSSFQERTVP